MQPENFIRPFLRIWFHLSSRKAAVRRVRKMAGVYLDLAAATAEDAGRQPVRVPKMPGVDEEMRGWSFFMLLQHNAIVNRSITAVVRDLAAGREPGGAGAIDPKHDVLPSSTAGPEQVAAFRESVEAHLATVETLGRLRGTRTKPHPVFGDFDAHMWHCMFAFHLKVHLRQARLAAAGRD